MIDWLKGHSVPGISRILKRMKFSRKQALMFIRSPDPAYASKQAAIEAALAEVAQQPGQVIVLYLDELTYYRRPSKAPAYAPCGHTQPLACLLYTSPSPRDRTRSRMPSSA